MAVELWANVPVATITTGGTGAPASGTTETWTAVVTRAFPTAITGANGSSVFHVADPQRPGEVIAVTTGTGSVGTQTWTVTRGAEHTTPQAHSAGFIVQQMGTAGGLASIPDWVNVTSPLYGADPTGTNDSYPGIQAALNAASPGQTVYAPAGLYKTSAPLLVPPCVTFQGAHGGIAGADTNTTTQKGTVLQPTASFTGKSVTVAGANWPSTSSATITANAVVALLDCNAGGYPSYSSSVPGASTGVFIRDIFIDSQFSPASVDGIAAYGSVAAVRLSDVGMNAVTGNGVIGYIYSISGTFYQPDGWHAERVIAQNVTGDSFGQFIWVDATWVDCHAQGGGPGAEAANGFNINQSSVRLVGCRSEFRQTSFRIQFGSVSGGSYAPIILEGCTSDQSDQNGIWVQSTSTVNYQNPVILNGCQVDAAGANAGAGGGGYAGIRVTGRVSAVTIANCQVWTGAGATPGPANALVVEQYSSGNHPQAVQVVGGVLNGVTAAISNDATATSFYVDPSVMTVTGDANAGFTYSSDPYESVASFKQVILSAASNGGMLQVTNTQSAPANPPFQLTAAAASDLLFGFKVTGDTNNRWNSDSTGLLKWGPGNATQDTNLYRAGSGLLATDESFQALSGFVKTQRFLATGITGATAASRYVGATASGAPVSGTFLLGDFIIDQTGLVWVCTVAGSPGTWLPAGGQWPPGSTPESALGILAWNFPSAYATSSSPALTSGTVYVMRVPLAGQSISVTNIVVGVTTAGSGLTSSECFAGLYDNTGAKVGGTGDQSGVWNSTGTKTMALTGGPFATSATYAYVVIVSNGTTNPQFARAAGAGTGASLINLNATAANLLAATNGTGATTLPGSLTYSSNSGTSGQMIWVGLS